MTNSPGEREGRVVAAIPEDTYARRLMLARDHAGHLSIREAAERCGLNYASWAGWERGAQSRTLIEDTALIAEGLGVDRDWLLRGGALSVSVRARALARRLNDGYVRRFAKASASRRSANRPSRVRRSQRLDHPVGVLRRRVDA